MNIKELFDNEIYHNYGMLTTDEVNILINYLKEETMEYLTELQKELAEEARLNGMGAEREAKLLARVAELEETISQLSKADASLRAQNEAQERNAVASAKRIAELELRLGCSRDASTGKDLLIAELEGIIRQMVNFEVRPVRDTPLTRDPDVTIEERLKVDPAFAVALYHEQRKQIEELADSLDRNMKTTELHRTTSETAHMKYFELSSKYTAAVQRIEELEELIEEYTSSYKTIMQERCGDDERHCTCVPPLKLRVRELENKVVRLERQLSPQIDSNKSEVNINRGEAIGWTDPRTMTCEQLANEWGKL